MARSSRSPSPRGRRSARATCCSRSIPRPYEAALALATATKEKDAGATRHRAGRPRALWPAGRLRLPDPAELRGAARPGGAAPGRDQRRRGADRHRPPQSRLYRHPLADRRPAGRSAGRCRQSRARDRQHAAGVDHPDQADLRQLHAAAGRARPDPAAADAGAAGGDRAGERRQDRARRGQAHADRQHDRPGDRHDPPEGELRQPRRAPVARRVRQPARDSEDAARRRHGAVANRAGRAGRPLSPMSSARTTRSSGGRSKSPRCRTASR